MACDKVIDKAKKIAAHQLEANEDDLEFAGGSFTVKGSPDKAMPLAAIAFEAFTAHNLPDGLEPNLEAQVTYDPPNFSWPFGTHICVVEIDTETGEVDVLQYVAVDDCGNQVNPLIVDGQVHGGVVQGLAQALYEEAVYDSDGNLKTASLAEYLVPAASDVPIDHARPHHHPVAHQPVGRQGHRRGRHHRRRTRGHERRRRRTLAASASPTCRCPPARTTSGRPSNPPKEQASDPRSIRLRPRRFGRRGDQPHRSARRRGQVPRRWPQPAAADEAAPRVSPACWSTSAASATCQLHPRRRRPRRHRRPDPPHGRREQRRAEGARPVAGPRGQPRRRPPGASPRHDRRFDRPRRLGQRPAGHHAGARCDVHRPGPERHPRDRSRRLLPRLPRVGPGGRRDAHRDPRAEDERRRVELPEVQPSRPGLGHRRCRRVAPQRRFGRRSGEHGQHAHPRHQRVHRPRGWRIGVRRGRNSPPPKPSRRTTSTPASSTACTSPRCWCAAPSRNPASSCVHDGGFRAPPGRTEPSI